MKSKKIIIIFTDSANADNAQAMKDFLSGDKKNLPIIIGNDEFDSVIGRLIKEKLFSEDGFVNRAVEKFRIRRQATLMDKVPSQEVSFNANLPAHRKAYNILVRYTPCLIVLNDTSIMKDVLAARAKACPDVPVVMAVSGYVLNKQSVNKHISRYFVDNMTIKTALVNEGIPEDNVILTDLPIPCSFNKEVRPAEIYEEYKFEKEKPLLLVAVPAADHTGIREAINELQAFKDDFNIMVSCGLDRDMLVYARDRGIKAINEGREEAPFYALADIVISRPSPAAIAKAFYKNNLFFSLSPKGESEIRTLEYLKDCLAPVTKENTLTNALKTYLENKETFAPYRDAITARNKERTNGSLFKQLELLVGMAEFV